MLIHTNLININWKCLRLDFDSNFIPTNDRYIAITFDAKFFFLYIIDCFHKKILPLKKNNKIFSRSFNWRCGRAECRTRESEELEVSKVRKPTSASWIGNEKPEKHESAGTRFRKSRSQHLQSEGLRLWKTYFSLRYIDFYFTHPFHLYLNVQTSQERKFNSF